MPLTIDESAIHAVRNLLIRHGYGPWILSHCYITLWGLAPNDGAVQPNFGLSENLPTDGVPTTSDGIRFCYPAAESAHLDHALLRYDSSTKTFQLRRSQSARTASVPPCHETTSDKSDTD